MRETLKKSETITDKTVSISGSFDHRLSTLETAMRPTQIRTHAIWKAHENIDKTLKTAEVILSQFDLSIQVEDPLMQATKYLKLLQKYLSESIETYLLSFDVNMRKQKTLLVLQAVKLLLWLDAEHPDSHRCLLHGKSLIDANTFFLEKHGDSLMLSAAVAEMLYVLKPKKKGEAITLIEGSTNNLVSINGAMGAVRKWRLKDCITILKLLDRIINDHDAASIEDNFEIYESTKRQQSRILLVAKR